jgi:hypothetical protein
VIAYDTGVRGIERGLCYQPWSNFTLRRSCHSVRGVSSINERKLTNAVPSECGIEVGDETIDETLDVLLDRTRSGCATGRRGK